MKRIRAWMNKRRLNKLKKEEVHIKEAMELLPTRARIMRLAENQKEQRELA